jgi:DNA-binding LacI/PurR family transcriptional regulator
MPIRVTLDDVAREAGVSRATASRALTGSGPASAAVRFKVRAAADKMGFIPNQAARTLASNRAQAIALVIPEPNALVLGDPFLGGIITGVSEVFNDTDYQLILVILRPDAPPDKASRVLRPGYVDGAIVVSHHRTGHLQELVADNDVPSVYVGRPWSGGGGSPAFYVDVDNRSVGRLAAEHLIARGARRIACLAGPPDMTPVDDRTAGWRDALIAQGLEPGPVEHAAFTLPGGAEATRRILDWDESVEAVFAQSDLMAAGAIQVLAERGRAVPDDVLVVGVDDSDVARTTQPRLTSVTNPAADLALRAARMLLRVIEGEDLTAASPEIVTPQLARRESA